MPTKNPAFGEILAWSRELNFWFYRILLDSILLDGSTMTMILTYTERKSVIWASSLSSDQKMLLFALNEFIGGNGIVDDGAGYSCYPSNAKIMAMTSLSRSSLKRTYKELHQASIIISHQRVRDNGSETSRVREVNFNAIPTTPNPPSGKSKRPVQTEPRGVQYEPGGVQVGPRGGPDWTGGGSKLDRGGVQSGPPMNSIYELDQFKSEREKKEDEEKCSTAFFSPSPTHVASKPESDARQGYVEVPDPWMDPQPTETYGIPFLLKDHQPSLNERNVLITSAAAPPKKARKSPKTSSIDADLWIAAHNDYRPANWPAIESVKSPSRLSGIRALIGHYGSQEAALEAYKVSLTHIRISRDSNGKPQWWAQRPMTMDNLLRTTKGHVIGLHEQARAANVTAIPRELSPAQQADKDEQRRKDEEERRQRMQANIQREREELQALLKSRTNLSQSATA